MSDASSQQRAPGFLWLLGALAGFAIVAMLLNTFIAGERPDPRAEVRAQNRDDIAKVNNDALAKIGLAKGASDDALAKGLAAIKAQAPVKSAMVVPGSPTQLKQAAAAAPAPAPAPDAKPAAPAPAPAK